VDVEAAIRQTPVAVLCGGRSPERDVSRESGRAVYEALAGLGLEVHLVDLADDSLAPLEGFRGLVFLAMHGVFGEDGGAQSALEAMVLPYTGSDPESSARAFCKKRSKEAFRAAGVPTPADLVLSESAGMEDALDRAGLSLPLVVKPVRAGSSQGVTIVRKAEALEGALAEALRWDAEAMVEPFLPGAELTVGILERRALPVIEMRTTTEFFDYEAKYSDGVTEYICPAELSAGTTARVRELALAAHDSLGARDLSRVDILLDAAGAPSVLEVNTIPGFTSHSLLPKAARAAGIPFPELCLRLLELAHKRSAGKR
jgi:D-alanine-D-alanine ligase